MNVQLRRCIGSTRFGIEAHDVPATEFPAQPSAKGGFGRMCKVHWNQYTAALARDRKARLAADRPKKAPTKLATRAEATKPAKRAREARAPKATATAKVTADATPGGEA